MKSILFTFFFALLLGAQPALAAVPKNVIEAIQADGDTIGYQLADIRDAQVVDDSELKGAAKQTWDEWTEQFSEDYPPESAKKTYEGVTVIILSEMNDGGGYYEVYELDGTYITGISGGESSGWEEWN
jgi:hypothetical protein